MIFTGAFTAFIFGFRQKHPHRNAITIDYNLAMFIVPMLLFGTMVGVVLNKILPAWIILISLTIVLIINCVFSYKKGQEIYQKENEPQLMKNEKNTQKIEVNNESAISQSNQFNSKDVIAIENTHANFKNTNLEDEKKKDLEKFPLDKIIYMFLAVTFMLIILIVNNHYIKK